VGERKTLVNALSLYLTPSSLSLDKGGGILIKKRGFAPLRHSL